MTPYQQRVIRQCLKWVNGKSEHNAIDDECCPDFSCCMPDLFEQDQTKRQAYLGDYIRRHSRPLLKRKERA